jgi:hypothetical protein
VNLGLLEDRFQMVLNSEHRDAELICDPPGVKAIQHLTYDFRLSVAEPESGDLQSYELGGLGGHHDHRYRVPETGSPEGLRDKRRPRSPVRSHPDLDMTVIRPLPAQYPNERR